MSDGSDPEIIKKTQQLLGKHVRKPPLTEKLLSKPPFRFLHDVVVAVIKNTGFLKGLFSQDELIPENVKDRDAKLAFLNKLIDAVKVITKMDLKVRATKIVAGVQVNETNLLLQAIAYGIDKKLDSSEYIKQYNSQNDFRNEQTKNKKIPTKDSKTDKSPKEEKSPSELKKTENRSKSKVRELSKDRKVPSKDSSVKDKKIKDNKAAVSSSRISKTDSKSKKVEKPKNTKETESPESISKISVDRLNEKNSLVKEGIVSAPVPDRNGINDASESLKDESKVKLTSEVDERPKTRDIENGYLAKINKEEKLRDEELQIHKGNTQEEPDILLINQEKNADTTSIPIVRQTSARPKSARPRSGDFKEKKKSPEDEKEETKNQGFNENIVLQTASSNRPKSSLRPPSVRPSSARPGAPRLRADSALPIQEVAPMGKINVIVENFDNDADDEETVVIHNAPEETLTIEPTLDLPAKNQSHLVEQILDQIKESEDIKTKVEIDWEQENSRGRDTTSKEMNHLRNVIQSFTKSANPLGKLLNYLHEDIETMHTELKQWTKIKSQLFAEIANQEKLKLEMDKPLLEKLESLRKEIAKQEQEIVTVRSNIIKNDIRIRELILK